MDDDGDFVYVWGKDGLCQGQVVQELAKKHASKYMGGK